MDGKSLLYSLRNTLNEDSGSAFLDDRTSYEYLYEAATMFASRTGALTAEQSITTVADQEAYTLNANYDSLYLRNYDEEYIVKYNDGATNTFPLFKEYERIIYEDETTSVPLPSWFTVKDKSSLGDQITGTATSTAAASAGLATLTDTSGDFSDAAPGDIIHNTTDGSSGYVVSKTSSTIIVVALFGGTANDWTSGDAYVIQPQGRMQLLLNAPPSTSGHTVTFYYNQRPEPVFSDYGVYRFPDSYMPAIVKYAAWLYKYRDREPEVGDSLFLYFDREVKRANRVYGNSSKHRDITFNLRRRRRDPSGN